MIAACELKEIYITHMRNLKQTLNYWLDWKTTHKVIKFNHILIWAQNYGKNQKNIFEKDFFKLMNNLLFRETMESIRKRRDIKLWTTEKRRNYLVSEVNYHATKFFSKNLKAIEMKKVKVYKDWLCLSILEL